MTLTQFINEHREEIKEHITKIIGHVPATASCHCPKSGTDHYHDKGKLDDKELKLWVWNDETLYTYAKSKGVKI